MIQSELITVSVNQEITKVTTMLGQRWYWRAKLLPTPIKHLQQINITSSNQQAGPFTDLLIAFKHTE